MTVKDEKEIKEIIKEMLANHLEKHHKEDYVGEYLKEYIGTFNTHTTFKSWEKFRESDIKDRVDGYIKIKDANYNGDYLASWYKKEDILLYDNKEEQYEKQRKAIEERLINQKETNV